MHLVLMFVSIVAVILRKDYLKWKHYYPTLQYVAIGNLTYNFLCASHWLWRLKPDINWYNDTLVELGYTFITFPATALMFLSHYPNEDRKFRVFVHYVFWIGLYVVFEFILLLKGTIYYKYGWSIGWSILFDIIMFPFIRFHHKNPLLALVFSFPVVLILLWVFDIPIHIPIEQR